MASSFFVDQTSLDDHENRNSPPNLFDGKHTRKLWCKEGKRNNSSILNTHYCPVRLSFPFLAKQPAKNQSKGILCLQLIKVLLKKLLIFCERFKNSVIEVTSSFSYTVRYVINIILI